jgi:hypothetical protein
VKRVDMLARCVVGSVVVSMVDMVVSFRCAGVDHLSEQAGDRRWMGLVGHVGMAVENVDVGTEDRPGCEASGRLQVVRALGSGQDDCRCGDGDELTGQVPPL